MSYDVKRVLNCFKQQLDDIAYDIDNTLREYIDNQDNLIYELKQENDTLKDEIKKYQEE